MKNKILNMLMISGLMLGVGCDGTGTTETTEIPEPGVPAVLNSDFSKLVFEYDSGYTTIEDARFGTITVDAANKTISYELNQGTEDGSINDCEHEISISDDELAEIQAQLGGTEYVNNSDASEMWTVFDEVTDRIVIDDVGYLAVDDLDEVAKEDHNVNENENYITINGRSEINALISELLNAGEIAPCADEVAETLQTILEVVPAKDDPAWM